MQRISFRPASFHRTAWTIFVAGILLTAAASGQSQSDNSLADAARASRANKQAQDASGAKPKVITNQDLPAGSGADADETDTMTTVSGVKKSNSNADARLNQRLQAEQRVNGQWKSRIEDQEAKIADLQTRIDRVTASMHAAVGTAQYDTPVSRYQAIQTDRLANLQDDLNQQKEKLAQMQDAARRAGMNQ